MRFLLLFFLIALLDAPGCAQQTAESVEVTTVILVRHAEKVKSEDKNPELSEKGKERALQLAELLQNSNIDVIYSTDYIRTKTTVEPLAGKIEKEIQIYNPRDENFIKKLLSDNPGKTILVSGHSNTTPMLVNQLLGKDKYQQLDESEYSKIFFVTVCGELAKDLILTY